MQPKHSMEADGHPLYDLEAFNELILQDPTNYVKLVIKQAEQPKLRILGPTEMTARYRHYVQNSRLYLKLGGGMLDRIIDALTTSLTRKSIRIELDVVNLYAITAKGMIEIDRSQFPTRNLKIIRLGPGVIRGPIPPQRMPGRR